MKFFLLFILLLSSLHGLVSQFAKDDYQVLIGKNFDDEALDIIEDYDYNISLVGYTQYYKTTQQHNTSYNNAFDYLRSTNEYNGEQLRLIKLNSSAQIVNDISLKLRSFNHGTSICKTARNGYILGGYIHSGQMLITRLNADGKSFYLKDFGTANFDQLHSLISMPDGSAIAIGTSQTSRNTNDNMFVQGLGRNDVYLVKFRPNGQIRWRKKYGSTKKDIGVDGAATNDGGFILLGITQEADDFKLWLAKISDTGDTLWVKDYPKSGRQKAFKITRLSDGDYLISASFENKNNQDNIRLIKIDNEGNVLWEHDYFNNAHEHLNDVNVDMRGNIIGVGYSQDEHQGDKDALVRYYDHNGNMIWERKFGKHRQDSFNAVSLLHDNSFTIAGFTKSFANKGRQIWVMKLNDDGSIVKIRQKRYTTLYEALRVEFAKDKDIQIYKNLRITHNGLIFKQGSASLTAKHKEVLKNFMPRLTKVLNSYKQEIKNIQVNGYTSTEWNAPNTQRYLNNAHLSNDRAMHILDYSYSLKTLKKYHNWLSQKLSTDGYSYSNLILADKKENKVRSRRVEFEIRLKIED